MNQKSGVSALEDACRRKTLNRVLEKYVKHCREDNDDDEEASSKPSRKRSSGRFPNIAGFCRFNRTSVEELEELSSKYPIEIAQIYAIFEDEALNSGLPPAVLSAYLKKRLGYEKETPKKDASGQMSIRFEHDIFNDGE